MPVGLPGKGLRLERTSEIRSDFNCRRYEKWRRFSGCPGAAEHQVSCSASNPFRSPNRYLMKLDRVVEVAIIVAWIPAGDPRSGRGARIQSKAASSAAMGSMSCGDSAGAVTRRTGFPPSSVTAQLTNAQHSRSSATKACNWSITPEPGW